MPPAQETALEEIKTINKECASEMDSETSFRLAMFNCHKFSDVTFLVGQENPEPVYAYRAVLMLDSEVFRAMFSGDFADLKEIPITDMELAVFMELLKFIYAGPSAMTLDTSNMLGLLYGAQKYMLLKLKSICEDFIVAHTNELNVLEIYDASQFFENKVVQNVCFKFLLENPMLYFENEKFKELSTHAIKNLVQQPAFNCSGDELRQAVLNWQIHQVDEKETTNVDALKLLHSKVGIKKDQFDVKTFFNIRVNGLGKISTSWFRNVDTICYLNGDDVVCKSLDLFRRSPFSPASSSTKCVNSVTKFVYGLGIYTGHFPEISEEITITLSDRDYATDTWIKLKSVTRTIKQQNDVSISCVYFDKVEIKEHLLCQICFSTFKTRYTQNLCTQAHNHFSSNCHLFSVTENHTPIACVFFSDGKECLPSE